MIVRKFGSTGLQRATERNRMHHERRSLWFGAVANYAFVLRIEVGDMRRTCRRDLPAA